MIGETISHYRIIEKLGQGGMGEVYLAEDTRLGRKVALKFLAPELARDHEAIVRFRNEARAAAELSHSNIATIHDFDEAAGRPFLVLEYLQGQTLRESVAQGPLPTDEVVRVGIALASGLHEAHSHGIVHRDIKSANIMLTDNGEVKILDFGLAHLADATQLTRPGTTLGTIAYMSPEQVRGETVDVRSDIWSLGVVLYQCLTGRLPFLGEQASVSQQIQISDPIPPTGVRSGISLPLEQVVLRCLEKDAELRYQHADDLRAELRRLESRSRGETPLSNSRKLQVKTAVSRQGLRRWAWVLAALTIVSVVGLGWWLAPWQLRSPEAADISLALIDFENLADPEDATLSPSISALVQTSLVENSPCRVLSSSYLQEIRRRKFGQTHGAIQEGQALEIARAARATLLMMGRVLRVDESPLVAWELVDVESGNALAVRRADGPALSALADAIVQQALPVLFSSCGAMAETSPRPVTELTTTNSRAYQHYQAGLLANERYQTETAARELLRAVDLDPTFALAHYALARVYWIANFGLAREHTERAFGLRSRLSMKDRLIVEAWRDQVHYRIPDAFETYREALGRWPDDRAILESFSAALITWFHFGEALDVSRQASRMYPESSQFLFAIQASLSLLGRQEQALNVARRLTEENPQNPNAWDELGIRYLNAGMPDSAEVAFQQALIVDPQFEFVGALQDVGIVSFYRGSTQPAIDHLEEILERTDLSPRDQYTTIYWEYGMPSLAQLCVEAGQYRRALELMDKADRYRSDPVDRIYHERYKIRVLLQTGHYREALDASRKLASFGEGEPDVAATEQFQRVARLGTYANPPRALAGLDSLAEARQALAKLSVEARDWGNFGKLLLNRASVEIFLAEGDPSSAMQILEEMEQLGYPRAGELAMWHFDRRAEAHVLAGELSEAASTLEEELRIFGGHAIARYELGTVYEQMKRLDDAEEQYLAFLELWANADKGLSRLSDARKRLKELRAGTF